MAREHLAASLENARLAGEGRCLVCGDTGFPLFCAKAGKGCEIEGGFPVIRQAAEQATARLTAEAYLGPTMVDALNRSNPGDNIGPGMPHQFPVRGRVGAPSAPPRRQAGLAWA